MVQPVHFTAPVPSEVPMLLQAGVRSRVAVIVNENARGVRPEVVSQLERLVPPRDLYVSRSLEHSRRTPPTGPDAQSRDDFANVARFIDRPAGPLASRVGAGVRYAATIGARSVPRFLATRLPEVELISTGDVAHRIDPLTGRVDETPVGK